MSAHDTPPHDRFYGLRHTIAYWVKERETRPPSHRPERMSVEIETIAELMADRDALAAPLESPTPTAVDALIARRLAQLREFAREHLHGGCKILSLGMDDCPCNLCAVDVLAAALRSQQEEIARLLRNAKFALHQAFEADERAEKAEAALAAPDDARDAATAAKWVRANGYLMLGVSVNGKPNYYAIPESVIDAAISAEGK